MKLSTGYPWLRRALSLLLLLAVALPAGSARAETALASGSVNSTTLNMRPDPSTHQAVVATLNRGDKVNVYEVSGVWLRIDVPSLGKSGYVSGKYITLNAGSSIYGFGVTSANVHVRSKNTAESESKGTVPSHTGLTLIKIESNGWWKVKTQGDGLEGYIAKKYVTVFCKAAKSSESGSTESAATVSASGVNLRSGASTKNKSLGLLQKGTKVTVLATSGDWYKVKVTSSGKTGYVYKTFVKISGASGATAAPKASASDASGTISASGVNLRSGASTKDKSLGLLQKGTKVTVLATSGDWHKVKVTSSGKTGYVYKTFVRQSGASSATPAPTSTPAPTATAAA